MNGGGRVQCEPARRRATTRTPVGALEELTIELHREERIRVRTQRNLNPNPFTMAHCESGSVYASRDHKVTMLGPLDAFPGPRNQRFNSTVMMKSSIDFGCGWESLMKSVTLGNVTMSHRTRESPPNALRLSMIGLPRAALEN
ncbi:hypothetical protein EVAR_44705_1 [Eumeta japonica]|uniref:Uncharacterized protein n=1 Tax=Eumeta variegata TaxID=151549 RepID=A0A4C1XIC9_EUMVA|nr:hypothetical protein EVAR_44705_1 [Eumeta japonica]